MVDRALVQKLASAAHITLATEEVDRLAAQLTDILSQIAPLAQLAAGAVEGVEAGAVPALAPTALRADETGADPMTGGITRFAPEVKAGFFTVPRQPVQPPR